MCISLSCPCAPLQAPKRRKIKTPAYLKDDFITIGVGTEHEPYTEPCE